MPAHSRQAKAWTTNRGQFRYAWLAAALVLCVWLGTAIAGAAGFTASLDRDTITLGESATLSLTFEGGSPKQVPTPPATPNLEITSVGSSQQFSLNNGQASSSITHNFNVTPRQPGDYTIPALTAEVAGEKLSTPPLTLKVLKPTTPSSEAIKTGSQPAFIKLVLPRQQVYVGETLAAQIECYALSRLGGASQFQLTGFTADGFNVGKMVEGDHRQVRIWNSVYTVIPLRVALKVLKAGPMTLGPVTFNLIISERDPFDAFGFFGRGRQQQLPLAGDAVRVQSLPLPREGMPPGFNGAVGNYTMTLTAGPTNVAAGDPITVRIEISGRGSLDTVTLPDAPAWREFKTFPPTTKVATKDPLEMQGTKTFEQIITPQSTNVQALPPISFSFFDPDQKAYRTLTHPAVPLVVRPGAATPAPVVLANVGRAAQDSPPPTQDIVPNKQRLGAVAQIGPPLALQPWFLALQAAPVLAFVSAVLWRKRADNFACNPRLRRQRQVAQLVREGLGDLRRLAAENKSDDFFAALFRLLQEQLGERLDLPASAITEAVIDERLRPRGVPDTTLGPLQELFQACNLARYAPIKSSQELAAMVPKAEAVLGRLQEWKV